MSDLLPANATKLEHALANITEQKLDLPVDIGDLWNADKCPLQFLPWLAYQHSVDYWDADWHEDVKRAAIKSAIYTHSIKGTRKAIENALLVIGIIADVTAWHEFEPKKSPYTFEVIAWVSKQIKDGDFYIAPDLYSQARAMIDAHKSARDSYVLKVGAKFNAGFNIVGTSRATNKLNIAGDEVEPSVEGQLNIAASMQFTGKHSIVGDEIEPKITAQLNIAAFMNYLGKFRVIGSEIKPSLVGNINIAAAMRPKAMITITGVDV